MKGLVESTFKQVGEVFVLLYTLAWFLVRAGSITPGEVGPTYNTRKSR